MKKNLYLYYEKPGHRAKECLNKQHLYVTQEASEMKTLVVENME
jgi:hypothetical protein